VQTLEEVFDAAIASRMSSVWTALPGRVVSFAPASSRADVQPLPATYLDGQAVALPILQGVRVAFPAGAGASLTYTLRSGDPVLLIFSTLPLSRYRDEGSEGDPGEVRRQSLSDAWAIPLAAGNPPAATAGKVVLAQGDESGDKVQLGVSPALAPPVVPVPLLPGPVIPVGFKQPDGRVARSGDTVKIVIDAAALAGIIAGMAAIAAGNPPTSVEVPGVIASGSSVVEATW